MAPRARKSAPKSKATARSSPPSSKRDIPRNDGPGRPTKFTPETRNEILRALRRGAFRLHAAHHARIGYATLNDWLNIGEADIKAGNEDTEHARFVEDVKAAEAAPVIKDLAVIEVASARNWQAAAWRLERRWPNLFGRRVVDHRDMNEAEARKAIAEALGIAEDDLPPVGEA